MAGRGRGRNAEGGITYVEVLATATIMAILAMAIVPTAKAGRRRVKEMELRRTLREIHGCIDEFKYRTQAKMGQVPPPGDGMLLPDKQSPYPDKLEHLVEGPNYLNLTRPFKCLRALPIDPMTDTREWRLFCADDSENTDSCTNTGIWKVTSASDALSSDGKTRYNDPKHW